MTSKAPGFLLLPLLFATCTLAAAQSAPSLSSCAQLEEDTQRLKCYDSIARNLADTSARQEDNSQKHREEVAPATAFKNKPLDSPLGKRWAIGQQASGLMLRPHEPMYLLLVRHSNNPNQNPSTPTQSHLSQNLDSDSNEAKYQLSMKFRVVDAQSKLLPNFWLGYTQQSQWQVYNGQHSRPFRETNYMPEAMLVWHPDRAVGPLSWRLFNLGYIHQSNGRADPLSRSWDRVYAQFGLDTSHFVLLVRPWWRLRETSGKDDNPDVTHYLGDGDVVLSYLWGKHQFSTKLRGSINHGKGYAEFTWSYLLGNGIKTYVQATSGYGESMIDYNVYQTTIGAGIALYDW